MGRFAKKSGWVVFSLGKTAHPLTKGHSVNRQSHNPDNRENVAARKKKRREKEEKKKKRVRY